ncbi:KIN protein [Loa loa]|uniref:KIN protein n=1 Tax=Loa loa TaxID=7209 RepID=A0A1I7VNY4_LOALO|nr:KIN protein [Loa loa]EFO20074.1 KIN protein [Loa loa]
MGKYEKGTPKEIANRCKSKGLQKLRWFCQMCKKQCRDQNGFKCHLTSETHQRQLLLFAENPNTYLKEYSEEFEKNFLKVLRSTFGTKRVRANEVYQEYIRDKMHTHMNSTKWHTLTNFVIYLGKSGKCHVDQTEKGWFIAWIDQQEELRKQEALHKVKAIHDDEERLQQLLEGQAERAREKQQKSLESSKSHPTELLRTGDDEKITFSLATKKPTDEELTRPGTSVLAMSNSVFDTKIKREMKSESELVDKSKKHQYKDEFPSASTSKGEIKDDYRKEHDNMFVESNKNRKQDLKPKKNALDEIMEMEERRKEKRNRRDNWLHKGIIVKITTKKFGNDLYKAKGVIKQLVDDFTAILDVNGRPVEISQENVETVIPAVGREMLVVNGAYRGTKAVLQAIEEKKFAVVLRLDEGLAKGRVLCLPYEDVCKLKQ